MRAMHINSDRYNSPWSGNQGQEYYKRYTKKNQEAVPAAEETKEQEATDASGSETDKTCREQILEKMAEMAKNVKEGTVEPKFQIGAMAYTMKEWDKLLEKFDAAEEALQGEVQAQIEEAEKQAAKEALRREMDGKPDATGTETAAAVTELTVQVPAEGNTAGGAGAEQGTVRTETVVNTVQADAKTEELDEERTAQLLTEEVVKCSYPTDDPKEKHWFITAFTQDGIICKEAYFDGTRWVNRDCFRLPFTEEGQYERVMDFLMRFPSDANLRFAANENFWKDFLAGEIDEDEFVNFFESTKDGVPDYTYTEGDSTYIDEEKIKYAKYMNRPGAAELMTADEMLKKQEEILAANKKKYGTKLD